MVCAWAVLEETLFSVFTLPLVHMFKHTSPLSPYLLTHPFQSMPPPLHINHKHSHILLTLHNLHTHSFLFTHILPNHPPAGCEGPELLPLALAAQKMISNHMSQLRSSTVFPQATRDAVDPVRMQFLFCLCVLRYDLCVICMETWSAVHACIYIVSGGPC